MRARIQKFQGGGGGGSNCFSREVRYNFSSRKRMASYNFHGEVRTPCPLCLRPYQSFKQFEFTFYLFYLFIFFFFCCAGPGQFTKRLLIISAVAKGKDSMILFKIKETAHINSGHVRVVLKFGVARDDGLDARKCTLHNKQWPRRNEQVEQGSCVDPEIFVKRGGGGGGGSRPDGQKTVWTMFF